jgi:zinc protease
MRGLRVFSLCCGTLLLLGACFTSAPARAMVEVDDTSIHSVPIWYAADDSVPVIHMVLRFSAAGSASDAAGIAGRAMLASRMLTEGAGEMDAEQFHRALEAKAITLRISTERDDLVVSLHTLSSELPEAVRLLTLALTQPRFDAAALEIAKNEQRSAFTVTEESPMGLAQRAWDETLFAGHPYGQIQTGNLENITAVSASDLASYRARYITRGNLQIAVAGDVSASQLKSALSPFVDALPEAFFPERDLAGVTFADKTQTVHVSHAGDQAVVLFGGKGIARSDARYYAAYLMNQALGGGGLSSRLMKAVRVKKGLVYGIGTGLINDESADSFIGQFATRSDQVDAAISAVKDATRELAESGLSQRECSDIKRDVVQRFALRLDSTRGIADIIATMMRYDLGKDYLEKRAERFEAVTCEQIQNVAKELLRPDQWLYVVVGEATAPNSRSNGSRAAEAKTAESTQPLQQNSAAGVH